MKTWRQRRWGIGLFRALMAAWLVWMLPGDASATNRTFVGVGSPSYTGSWHVVSHWSLPYEPTGVDDAYFSNNGATADLTQPGETCGNLFIGNGAGVGCRLNLLSGDLTVEGVLYLSNLGDGTLVQSGGTLLGKGNILVGNYGMGVYTQLAGSVECRGTLTVSDRSGSRGFYRLSGPGTLLANASGTTSLSIGGRAGSNGRFVQEDGVVICPKYVYAGNNGTGTYELAGGQLVFSNQLYVGNTAGSAGTFLQTGGTNQHAGSSDIYIGSSSNAPGAYTLAGGKLTIANNRKIFIGYHGYSAGAFTLNTNSSGTGQIVGPVQILVADAAGVGGVTSPDLASGVFQGFGVITGSIANSGRVIADGYGTDKTLEFTGSFNSSFTNGVAETNGWFAQNGGKLVLKPIDISAGIHAYYWAEQGNLDMINAFRLDMVVGHPSSASNLVAALLAPDRTDAGVGDQVPKIIGLWEISCTAMTAGGTVTFRYDHTAAATKGVNESDLQIYQYTGGRWTNVTGSVNPAQKTITTKSLTTLGKFAIGGPWAGTLMYIR